MGEETDASPFANLSTSRENENQEYITSADTHKVGQELGTLDPLFANSVLSNAISSLSKCCWQEKAEPLPKNDISIWSASSYRVQLLSVCLAVCKILGNVSLCCPVNQYFWAMQPKVTQMSYNTHENIPSYTNGKAQLSMNNSSTTLWPSIAIWWTNYLKIDDLPNCKIMIFHPKCNRILRMVSWGHPSYDDKVGTKSPISHGHNVIGSFTIIISFYNLVPLIQVGFITYT